MIKTQIQIFTINKHYKIISFFKVTSMIPLVFTYNKVCTELSTHKSPDLWQMYQTLYTVRSTSTIFQRNAFSLIEKIIMYQLYTCTSNFIKLQILQHFNFLHFRTEQGIYIQKLKLFIQNIIHLWFNSIIWIQLP